MGRPKNTMGDFWRHVDIRGDDECWEWQLSTRRGYGRFSIGDKAYSSHRLALSTVQEVPEDALVCHSCDNPACCNPKHMFIGTPQDNMTDKVEKGRQYKPSGELHHNTPLLECEVHFIKHSDISNKRLGEIFEVGRKTIWQIKTGRRWGHVA